MCDWATGRIAEGGTRKWWVCGAEWRGQRRERWKYQRGVRSWLKEERKTVRVKPLKVLHCKAKNFLKEGGGWNGVKLVGRAGGAEGEPPEQGQSSVTRESGNGERTWEKVLRAKFVTLMGVGKQDIKYILPKEKNDGEGGNSTERDGGKKNLTCRNLPTQHPSGLEKRRGEGANHTKTKKGRRRTRKRGTGGQAIIKTSG